jgi:hypothetical protein
MKRTLLTLLAALTLTVGLQANPAVAAPAGLPGLPQGEVICFIEYRNDIPIRIRCIAFGPIQPDCIRCDTLAVDFGVEIHILDHLAGGFAFLDQAARALDPDLAARARTMAKAEFLTVARALPDNDPVVRDTGYVDRHSGRFVSSPQAHLVNAGREIDEGMRWLRLAGLDPDGDPAYPIEQGMRHLGNAYQLLRSEG